MGGKQSIPWEVPKDTLECTREDIPKCTPQYKRFCSVCRRQTYAWNCCGQRTQRVNLQPTIGQKVKP